MFWVLMLDFSGALLASIVPMGVNMKNAVKISRYQRILTAFSDSD
jgi:hypothetical protein